MNNIEIAFIRKINSQNGWSINGMDQRGGNYSQDRQDRLKFCCYEMQGWRVNMEDSCVAELDVGDGNSLFEYLLAIVDPEIAKFVKNNFNKNLLVNPVNK